MEVKIETFGQQNDQHHQEQNETTDESKSVLQIGTLLAQKEQELMLEQQAKQMLETRLEDAIKSGQEAETARNLLERDIQEKQDAIITLRAQLEEVKTINIQLFKKMQDKDCQLKEKNNQLVECESNINQLTKDLRLLQQKYVLLQSKDSLWLLMLIIDNRLSQQNEERRAKELAENYQRIIDEQQEQMTRMQLELDTARIKQSEQIHFQEAYNLLKKKFDENELALEEIGKQLQELVYIVHMTKLSIYSEFCHSAVRNWRLNRYVNIMATLRRQLGLVIVMSIAVNIVNKNSLSHVER